MSFLPFFSLEREKSPVLTNGFGKIREEEGRKHNPGQSLLVERSLVITLSLVLGMTTCVRRGGHQETSLIVHAR